MMWRWLECGRKGDRRGWTFGCLVGRLTEVQNTGRGSRKCTLGVGNGDCCNLYELELLWDIGFTNGKGPEIS